MRAGRDARVVEEDGRGAQGLDDGGVQAADSVVGAEVGLEAGGGDEGVGGRGVGVEVDGDGAAEGGEGEAGGGTDAAGGAGDEGKVAREIVGEHGVGKGGQEMLHRRHGSVNRKTSSCISRDVRYVIPADEHTCTYGKE